MVPAPGKIAFAAGTLDRAAHLRDDGSAERLRDRAGSRVVAVGEAQSVALLSDGGVLALALAPLAEVPAGAELTFLGLEPSGAGRFAYDAVADGEPGRAGGPGEGEGPASPGSSSSRCAASVASSIRATRRSRPTRSRWSAGIA